MQNYLKDQTSPYLLQHADNPVHWYPWCAEAFERAKEEDKPIFLSIGYSTCHWCHVMAHESFEDEEIAQILNQYFISIKVDKEERPDIDSIYMSVCQAFTGSGGWPTTIFLTPEQKPFFAGTYFPKTARFGQTGLKELLLVVHESWKKDRKNLLESADEIISMLDGQNYVEKETEINTQLITDALEHFKRAFDENYGGFGRAPKFPTPHNLLFLMRHYEKTGDDAAIKMVEKTLIQMYRGGIFDHIGGGFSRYSTDRYFLVPHFEKMLYDNALLILAYSKAYQITKNRIYRDIAEKTAEYILREMTSPEGGFYSAQDADSEGVEGKYYLFVPSEIINVLGEQEGNEFNQHFDITEQGNFEGKSIPNLLKNENYTKLSQQNENMSAGQKAVYEFRKNRYTLHLDDKILTSWNTLMIVAMSHLYRVTGNDKYLISAVRAQEFIQDKLCDGDTLYVSYRNGQRSGKGFLDDYANEILALIALYEATLDNTYLKEALRFTNKATDDFYDKKQGGFFLYGKDNEQLILRPKETYDGAMPSGNSVMAYNFVQLHLITGEDKLRELAESQIKFMTIEAKNYPTGYAMFLMALSDYVDLPDKITLVLKEGQKATELACKIPLNTLIYVLENPTKEYQLKNGNTTFYICKGRTCLPPVNELNI